MREAIALRPTDPVLYTHLAAIYAAQANGANERLDMAYGAYEAAISLAPTIALTYRLYADVALRSGDVALASKQAVQAVDLDATDGISFGILGWARLQEGKLPAAQRAFEQAVKWQPDSADFYLGLATVYHRQGRLDAAERSLQQSLAIDPAYAPSLTLRLQLQVP
jgi:tetratricopeptide (TPR) repeat protein